MRFNLSILKSCFYISDFLRKDEHLIIPQKKMA